MTYRHYIMLTIGIYIGSAILLHGIYQANDNSDIRVTLGMIATLLISCSIFMHYNTIKQYKKQKSIIQQIAYDNQHIKDKKHSIIFINKVLFTHNTLILNNFQQSIRQDGEICYVKCLFKGGFRYSVCITPYSSGILIKVYEPTTLLHDSLYRKVTNIYEYNKYIKQHNYPNELLLHNLFNLNSIKSLKMTIDEPIRI